MAKRSAAKKAKQKARRERQRGDTSFNFGANVAPRRSRRRTSDGPGSGEE